MINKINLFYNMFSYKITISFQRGSFYESNIRNSKSFSCFIGKKTKKLYYYD